MNVVPASNRQLKILRLFGVPAAADPSGRDVRFQIARLFTDPVKKDLWNRYVYLTGDVSSDSPELKAFDVAALQRVVLAKNWSASRAEREYREATARLILSRGTPVFNDPPPAVTVEGHVFVFTGEFDFGTRKRCHEAVLKRGGLVPDTEDVSDVVDYLVVGARGSQRWKSGHYGGKIEAAVVERSIHGKPAILREEQWRTCLNPITR